MSYLVLLGLIDGQCLTSSEKPLIVLALRKHLLTKEESETLLKCRTLANLSINLLEKIVLIFIEQSGLLRNIYINLLDIKSIKPVIKKNSILGLAGVTGVFIYAA